MLTFALKNINSLMREYKAIFIMFFTVFSLVAVSLIYLHSFNLNLLKNSSAIDDKFRTYIILENMEQKKAVALIEEIKTKISGNMTESILCYADKEADVDGTSAVIAAAYGEVNRKQIALDRGSLESGQSGMQCIMDDIFYQSNAREDFIHDTIKINGEKFILNAVGHIGSENIDVMITMAGLQKINLRVKEVHIVFETRLSNEEVRILQEIVGEKNKLEIPPKYGSTISRQFIYRFIVIFALILMATINIMGLYRYLVMRRKKELLIYKIYGIRNGRLFTMILLETIILVSLGFMSGAILFIAITRIAGHGFVVTVNPAIFLQTYFIEIACSILGIVPILQKICKKSIFSEYVREEGE